MILSQSVIFFSPLDFLSYFIRMKGTNLLGLVELYLLNVNRLFLSEMLAELQAKFSVVMLLGNSYY